MKNFEKIVKDRRSVRTYEEKVPSQEVIDDLMQFSKTIENPYKLDVEFKLLDGKKDNLKCPVAIGTDLYIGGKIKIAEHLNEAFGYSFEAMILHAQELGLGTVWVGGTMEREGFEKAMNLSECEMMPCMTPVGYTAKKMSVKEKMMRAGIKADTRKDFVEIFFKDSFENSLTTETAGELAFAFEMIRLAPSAVNKQPWRIVLKDSSVHFYLKRSKGFGHGVMDIQKIDMGIAMYHFVTAANKSGINTEFYIDDPKISSSDGAEYIASYRII